MVQLRKAANHPFLFGEPKDDQGRYLSDLAPKLLIMASGKLRVLDRMLVRHMGVRPAVRQHAFAFHLCPAVFSALQSAFASSGIFAIICHNTNPAPLPLRLRLHCLRLGSNATGTVC